MSNRQNNKSFFTFEKDLGLRVTSGVRLQGVRLVECSAVVAQYEGNRNLTSIWNVDFKAIQVSAQKNCPGLLKSFYHNYFLSLLRLKSSICWWILYQFSFNGPTNNSERLAKNKLDFLRKTDLTGGNIHATLSGVAMRQKFGICNECISFQTWSLHVKTVKF